MACILQDYIKTQDTVEDMTTKTRMFEAQDRGAVDGDGVAASYIGSMDR